ncbi:heat shock protein, Hsp20 family [Polychytrium aggregatum]|uniref:heat shock protein, Hsp20 family n=1 Tax=Polychytrium aggregatum TaxID=110093 RepID=UPI0022FE3D9A|nr:heat shock protein, Hsp20 family [Polychytrium aggregatum]KAI9199684.1 heat shock protein, Hsp20 family [Polychytrium aggregatum]
MTDAVAQQTPTWGFFRTPRLDVIETEDAFVVKADLPGLKKNQVRISLLDGILTIEGERHAEHDESSDTLHMVECSYGQFQRKLRLPPTVDAEKIEARMAEGVLELKIAKKELPPPAVPKKILIQ